MRLAIALACVGLLGLALVATAMEASARQQRWARVTGYRPPEHVPPLRLVRR